MLNLTQPNRHLLFTYLFFIHSSLKKRKIPYTIKLAPQKYNASSSQLPTVKSSNEKIHLLQK